MSAPSTNHTGPKPPASSMSVRSVGSEAGAMEKLAHRLQQWLCCVRSEPTSRSFEVAHKDMDRKELQTEFCGNSISTSKYTLLSFVPKSLLEQFRRLANVYFLIIVIMLLLGTYTPLFDAPLTPWTTLLPLVVVLLVTMFKEGVEDIRRHMADRETNMRSTCTLRLDRPGEFEEIRWKDIKVGRVIKVTDRKEIPADIILLTSSEPNGNCYIETSNIDGETNLKLKQAAPTSIEGTGPIWRSDPAELFDWRARVDCEPPNSRIHQFSGVIRWPDGRDTPVDESNLLLRGSLLRNTKWVLGLVVYTGVDTKLVRNSREAPSKLSTVESTVNKLLWIILGSQIALTTASLFGFLAWKDKHHQQLSYLCINPHPPASTFLIDNCGETKGHRHTISVVGMWLAFFTLFNNFIPISLYVTMEMVNYVQAAFIDYDRQMYDESVDMPTMARTSNMNGDLASVQYVFSDKTGTLTRNIMEFKRCSVGGVIYGNIEQPLRPDPENEVQGRPLEELGRKSADARANPACCDFMLVLCLCHTVVIEQLEDGGTAYQAESPDEEALVSAAASMGFRFTGRGPGEAHVQLPPTQNTPDTHNIQKKGGGGEEVTYKILCTVPFTSARKRMSVVVKAPDGRILLMCKGADNVIHALAKEYRDTSRQQIDEHLRVFAEDGLRTLLLAVKELTPEEFKPWLADFKKASAQIQHRSEAVGEVAERLERDLTVVGCTAIEDRLQDEVPETIADLLDAGIRVWVLTGDKMETAINIGYSCRLLAPNMILLKVKDEGNPELVRRKLSLLLESLEWLLLREEVREESWAQKAWDKMRQGSWKGSAMMKSKDATAEAQKAMDDPEWQACVERMPEAPDFMDVETDELALVIDGPAMVHILGSPEHEKQFLRLARLCRSVVACRVSPAQKRMIVRLVKRGVRPQPITLAIGDGANDVAMIQEAQIGVGISGKEGKQAVNSSDFAISQFKYLRRLLLIHGRWNYRRMSKVILYSFYKNIVLTMILFYFSFTNGFSGQPLFEAWIYSGYNFFLAMPIICVGFFDKDMSEESVMKSKWVYMSGRDKMDLNTWIMLRWLLQALVDSVLIYFFCLGALTDPRGIWTQNGTTAGLYAFGLTVYSCLILAMMYKVAVITLTWTWVNWFFYFGSIALYLIFIFTYGSLLLSGEFYHVPLMVFSNYILYVLLLLVPAISLITSYTWMASQLSFKPTPVDIAVEKDRIQRSSRSSANWCMRVGVTRFDNPDDAIPPRAIRLARDQSSMSQSAIAHARSHSTRADSRTRVRRDRGAHATQSPAADGGHTSNGSVESRV